MKLTGENGYGIPDEHADAHVLMVLRSMCEHRPSILEDVVLPDNGLACIHRHLVECGLEDESGSPTEAAYGLLHRIPIMLFDTAELSNGLYVSAASVRDYEASEEKEGIITGSGLIIACINNGSVEIYGTEDAEIACNIGYAMGFFATGDGDLVLAAVSEDPAQSFVTALSIALRVARPSRDQWR